MRPARYRWTGVAWQPLPAFAEDCDKEFVLHEERWLDAHHDRSMASHNHYFAALNTAWATLPEDLALRFPTPQALRKWCLIETGWYTAPEPFMMATQAEALRHALELSRRHPDDRVYVDPDDPRRVVWKTAKSQSYRAMRKVDFQKSKDDVLRKLSELIGVPTDELERNAGRAA